MDNRQWFKDHLNSNEGQNREVINLKREQNRHAIKEHKEKLLRSKQELVKDVRMQSNDCSSVKNKINKDYEQ